MTEAAAIVSAVDDDPSLREAFQSLIKPVGLCVATFGAT
jgi:FixJ family two-component response regulator